MPQTGYLVCLLAEYEQVNADTGYLLYLRVEYEQINAQQGLSTLFICRV